MNTGRISKILLVAGIVIMWSMLFMCEGDPDRTTVTATASTPIHWGFRIGLICCALGGLLHLINYVRRLFNGMTDLIDWFSSKL